MRIGLVVLNRNEEEAVPVVVPRMDRSLFEATFVVDGNSTDNSPRMLEEFGYEVLAQTSPGRGEAFRIAFSEGRQRGLDALVLFSTDGNEDPESLPRFRPMLEAGADLVIASRMMVGAVNEEDDSWFRPRKWANIAFNIMAFLAFGRGQRRVSDGINGYRAITCDAWERMALDGPGYTIEYQSTIRAYKLRLQVEEFPTIEGQRIGGEAGSKAIPTGFAFLGLFFKELFSSARH